MTSNRKFRFDIPSGTSAIAVVALLLIASIWAYTADRGRSERIEAAAAEFSKNANLALALDVHTNQLLEGIDHFLLLIKDQYQGSGARTPIPVARLVAPVFAGVTSVTFVGVTNERGDVVESLREFSPTNVADRDFFQRHQRGETQALLISEPVLGRISGRWAITLTRRFDQPDGSFGGIVAISVAPRYLTELFETANLGPSDVMSLVLENGITLARRRGQALEFGEDISRSQLITEYARRQVGSFRGTGGIDGQMRMFNYRRMKAYPVIVTVGTLEADVMAPVHRRAERNRAGQCHAGQCYRRDHQHRVERGIGRDGHSQRDRDRDQYRRDGQYRHGRCDRRPILSGQRRRRYHRWQSVSWRRNRLCGGRRHRGRNDRRGPG